ncbi:hypothetical protein A6R68_23860, partial [Neotoma lepida]
MEEPTPALSVPRTLAFRGVPSRSLCPGKRKRRTLKDGMRSVLMENAGKRSEEEAITASGSTWKQQNGWMAQQARGSLLFERKEKKRIDSKLGHGEEISASTGEFGSTR